MQELDEQQIRKEKIKKALFDKFIENEDLINVDFKFTHEDKKLANKTRLERKIIRSIGRAELEPKTEKEVVQELLDLKNAFTPEIKNNFKLLLKDISLHTKIFDWKIELKIISSVPLTNGLSIIKVSTSGAMHRKDNDTSYFRIKITSKNRKISGEFCVLNKSIDRSDKPFDYRFLELKSFFYNNGFKNGMMGFFWSGFSSQIKNLQGVLIYNKKLEDDKSSFSTALKKIIELNTFNFSKKIHYIRLFISESIQYAINENYENSDFKIYLGYSKVIKLKGHYDEKDILRFFIENSYIKYDGTEEELEEIFKGDFKEIINILNLYNY